MVSFGCVHTNPDAFEMAFFFWNPLTESHPKGFRTPVQFVVVVFFSCFVLFCFVFSFVSLFLVGILLAFFIVYSTVPVYH